MREASIQSYVVLVQDFDWLSYLNLKHSSPCLPIISNRSRSVTSETNKIHGTVSEHAL